LVKSYSNPLAILVFAFLALPAQAQVVAVSGRVVDETGAGISGALLTVRAPGGGPAVAASSDLAGHFTLTIPIAGEYDLRVEREGFYVFTGHNQRFDENQSQFAITLNHQQEFPEKVEVKDSPPGIDPQQPADRRELNNTEIQAVPYAAPQDYRNALQLLNGVVADNSGVFHFNGAGSNQTKYTLDGFNISNPITGALDTRINIDTVQSMEVLDSRYSADNGGGSGGVLNLTSKIGDDHWRFIGTNFIPSVATDHGLHINKATPRLELSGPIKKGRVWIDNGFDAFYSEDLISGLPTGQNRERSLTADDITRLRAELKPGNILTGSFLWNLNDQTNNGLNFLNPQQTTTNSRQTKYMTTVRDQNYFSGGALLDVGFADTRGFLRSLPQGNQLYEITPFGSLGNYFVATVEHFYRQQAIASLFLPTLHMHGAHLLKFGVDFEREGFHQTMTLHDYEVLQADNSLARFVTFSGSPFERQNDLEGAQYFQDHWAVRDNLTIEAGVRAEWNDIVRELEIAPRFSAAWAPHGLGGAKFSAGYGVYYDHLNLQLIARPEETSFSTFYLPGGVVEGPAAISFMVNDHALTTPRYQTVSAGVERKLPFEFYGKAGYTHRQTSNAFAFETAVPESGSEFYTGAQFMLKNTRHDRYDAADFTLKRTFAGRYQWFLGYTRSSSRTNDDVAYSLINPVFGPQLPGPVPWDAPNRVHMWGWAPLPNASLPKWLQFTTHNTTAAYLVEYRTGFPFGVVDQQGFMISPPGSMRLPGYFSVNLHFERQFHALHYLWAWRVGVDNLTNNGNPNFVNNVYGTPYYLTYGRGQARAFTMRLRMLGKK
jgi:hypothetical protein